MITRSHETGRVTAPVMPKRYGTVTRPEPSVFFGTKGGQSKCYVGASGGGGAQSPLVDQAAVGAPHGTYQRM